MNRPLPAASLNNNGGGGGGIAGADAPLSSYPFRAEKFYSIAVKPKQRSKSQLHGPSSESENDMPITSAEEADKIVRSFQDKPIGLLSEEEKRQRRNDFKRALAFNHKRFFEDEKASRPKPPPAITDRDDAALWWCAARCVDEEFRRRFEGTMVNLTNAGVLFQSPFKMIQSSIERLLVVASKPVEPKFPNLPSLNQFFDPSKTAQEELAAICSLFIRVKDITAKGMKSIVAPWLQEEASREHFKARWQTRGRRKTPHNRIQFEFIFSTVATFDDMMKELFSGPLNGEDHDYPPPRSDAASFIADVTARNASMAVSLNLILDDIELMQAKSTYALGTPWTSGWTDLRLRSKERVIEILEPFIKNRWSDFKKQNPRKVTPKVIKSEIAKRPWKIAWQSLSRCLRTVMDEWPYPPLDPDALQRLSAKHSQHH